MKKSNFKMSEYLNGKAALTIALALERVALMTKNSHLNEDIMSGLSKEFEFLGNAFGGINPIQCYILAVSLTDKWGAGTYSSELCDFAQVSPIMIMAMQPDIENLIERNLLFLKIKAEKNDWHQHYGATEAFLEAVKYNKPLV